MNAGVFKFSLDPLPLIVVVPLTPINPVALTTPPLVMFSVPVPPSPTSTVPDAFQIPPFCMFTVPVVPAPSPIIVVPDVVSVGVVVDAPSTVTVPVPAVELSRPTLKVPRLIVPLVVRLIMPVPP